MKSSYYLILKSALLLVAGGLQSASAQTCVSPPSGLIGWWPADGNALEMSGTNHGTLAGNTAYASGKVGQAFVFDGNGDVVNIGNPASLQLQTFTIEAWVKRNSTNQISLVGTDGYIFGYGSGGYVFGAKSDGRLYLSTFGSGGIDSVARISDTNFHHVAVSKSGDTVLFYIDGVAEAPITYATTFTFTTAGGIGGWTGGNAASFLGLIDELAIYNRALTASEIQAIYNADNAGKCQTGPAPIIVEQPASQTVLVGQGATFSVIASNAATYQWTFNGTNIVAATMSALSLSNVTTNDGGVYTVLVSNTNGSVLSSNATLTVTVPSTCAASASGLVGWWPGDGNALDMSGTNHGTAIRNTGYVSGKAGQAFSFDGDDAVIISNRPAFQIQNFTIEAWVKRGSPANVSTDPYGATILGFGEHGYILSLTSDGRLGMGKVGVSGVLSSFQLTDLNLHHLAVTKSNSTVVFYFDGQASAPQTYNDTFTFSTDLGIGNRGDLDHGGFLGVIDEVALYNRALSTAEIQSIYSAGSNGKCKAGNPVIVQQPVSKTAGIGESAFLSVLANNALTYQWQFNGTNISSGTNSVLTFSSVTFNDAGNYAVLVGNLNGSVLSSNTVLSIVERACVPPASGIVGWWPGESNGLDIISTNHGTVIRNTTFASGKVGQAFVFDGDDAVIISNRPSLQLQNFTIEAWVRRGNATNVSIDPYGATILGYGEHGYILSITPQGYIGMGKVGVSGVMSPFQLSDLNFHHLAVTKSNSTVVFYFDGEPSPPQSYNTTFEFNTNLGIGNRGDLDHGGFLGVIDEVALYNRALTPAEIQSIHDVRGLGKCQTGPAPIIVEQPASQTVLVGQGATFSVIANNALTYQWKFNGTNIATATTSTLSLTNVATNDAGIYTVLVSNTNGSVLSSNAVLTVNTPPSCVAPVIDLVGWWSGDSNSFDLAGTNHGTLAGNTAYASGKVGQTFAFDGNGDVVNIGNPASLQLQTFTIEAWVKRNSTNQISLVGTDGYIFGYGSGGYVFGAKSDGRLYLSTFGSGGIDSVARISDTNFHHVAVSKSGNTVLFYIDGVAEAPITYATTFTFTTAGGIGGWTGGNAASFLGLIDELAIYNRALTASEIQAIYDASSTGKCKTGFPIIMQQPVSQTVFSGQPATFSVTAANASTYQWLFNGTNITGATGSAFNLSPASAGDAGVYSVQVGNTNGSVLSSNATLAVIVDDALIKNGSFEFGLFGWTTNNGVGLSTSLPASAGTNSVSLGKNNVSGSTLSQSFNGSSGTNYLLQFDMAASGSTGRKGVVRVEVASGVTVLFSRSFTNDAQPIPAQMIYQARNVPFAIPAPLTNLTLKFVDSSSSGGLNVDPVLDNIRLTPMDAVAPIILTHPQSLTVLTGESAQFSIGVLGGTPFSYQWRFNGTNLATATGSTLTLSNVTTNDMGSYSVVVSNANGSAISSNAVLTVNPPPSCVAPVAGLVSWWPGEGSATDIVGSNHGTLVGQTAYASGKAGQAFTYDGNDAIIVTNNPSLQLQDFTIEAWIKRANTTNVSTDPFGAAILGYGERGYTLSLTASGYLIISKVGVSGVTSSFQVSDTNFHHIAVTKTNSTVVFYLDGQASSPHTYNPGFEFNTNLGIGNRGDMDRGGFLGTIDEVALYNRALSTSELQSIYGASYQGKCKVLLPAILQQPASLTVDQGQNASFTVVAVNASTYQWQLNGSNIVNATGTALALSNVTTNDSGNYAVLVSNTNGSVLSSNAVLTVIGPPSCNVPASGLVAWWTGNGNALDTIGVNHGVATGNTTYASGKVGQGFSFDGDDGVIVSNRVDLQLQNLTIEAWIKRGSASQVSSDPFGAGIVGYGERGYLLYLTPDGHIGFGKVGVSGIIAPFQVTNLNFHHVAVTKTNSTVIFYLDGVATAAQTYGDTFEFNTNLGIGNRGDLNRGGFIGAVDEAALYNRALTSVEITAIYTAGSAGKCNVPITPFIVTQPGSATAVRGSDVSFGVQAGGSVPLNYQWAFNGTNIVNATNASLSLTNVQLFQAGNYAVTITNSAGSVSSSNAVLTVTLPPAGFQVGSITGMAGTIVEVPVSLVANGNENAFGFSLYFNTQRLVFNNVSLGSGAAGAGLLLNTNDVHSGQIGIAVALPSGSTFAEGTQQVVVVSFTSSMATNTASSSITFGNQPTPRQLSDAQAIVIPATYSGGTVTLLPSDLEADTAPRPAGDRIVSITDWVQVGRFVAHLDTAASGSEFQRADCAPRATQGNGRLTITDWVQAGRYAVGLDPLTVAGGPDAPVSSRASGGKASSSNASGGRTLVLSGSAIQGLPSTIAVHLEAQGNENAVGFSVSFDANQFAYGGASLGNAALSASLNLNTNLIGSGKLGLTLALPPGSHFAAGTREIVKIQLTPIAGTLGATNIAFGDEPVVREVSDSGAIELPASYTPALVVVNPLPTLSLTVNSTNVNVSWPLWAEGFGLQGSGTNALGAWSNVTGTLSTNGGNVIMTLPLGSGSEFFRLSRP